MQPNDEFEVYLMSNGSMNLYPNNTIAEFTNHLHDTLHLDGDWKVALAEISFPSRVKNITETVFVGYKKLTDHDIGETAMELDLPHLIHVQKELYDFDPGVYLCADKILRKIEEKSGIKVTSIVGEEDEKLQLTFNANEGLAFPTRQIPNILGFEGIKGEYFDETYTGIRIGADMSSGADRPEKDVFVGDYPMEITAGCRMVLVYINIIDYQYVAGTKAPLLRSITRNVRMGRNCSVVTREASENIAFKNLQFKKLLISYIKSIKVELRTETGHLVNFLGTGQTCLTLKFQKSVAF